MMDLWNHQLRRNKFLLVFLLPTVILLLNSTCGLPVYLAIDKPIVVTDDPSDNFVEFLTPSDSNITDYIIMYKIIETGQSYSADINAFDPSTYTGNKELPSGLEVPVSLKFFRPLNYTGTGLNKDTEESDYFLIPNPPASGSVIQIDWSDEGELPKFSIGGIIDPSLQISRRLKLNNGTSIPVYYQASFLGDFHYYPGNTSDLNPIDSDLVSIYPVTAPNEIRILFCVLSHGVDPSTVSSLYSQPVYLGEITLTFSSNMNSDIRD